MSTPIAGWYPDPSGQPGMFRFWDGQQWTTHLSANPQVPHPLGSTPVTSPYAPIALGQNQGYGQQGSSAYHSNYSSEAGKKPKTGLLLGILGGALVVVIVIVLVLRGLSVSPGGGGIGPGDNPLPSQDPCPKPVVETKLPKPVMDDRVHGGKISYPKQQLPWEGPASDNRVPFGRDAMNQSVVTEVNRSATKPDDWRAWVASMLVAELVAGDGFYGPQTGAEIVAKCVIGKFYGNNAVQREDISSKEITVDGAKGWQIEMHLKFDIPKLNCKGETAIIVVAANDTSSASLYYASIPDGNPGLLATARGMVDQLKIDK